MEDEKHFLPDGRFHLDRGKKEEESSEYFGLLCETRTGSVSYRILTSQTFLLSELSAVVIPVCQGRCQGMADIKLHLLKQGCFARVKIKQELVARHAQNPVFHQSFFSPVDQKGSTFGIVGFESS